MVDVINVAIGAMLGVILAESPMLKVTGFADMYTVFFFITLIILFSCNIWVTTRSLSRNRYGVMTMSIVIYFVSEITIFIAFTIDSALLPSGQISNLLEPILMHGTYGNRCIPNVIRL
jgi:hypothetical protein